MSARNLSRPFQLRAEAVDVQQRTLSAVIATETPVDVYDWSSRGIIREVLLLSGLEVAPHVPLLTDHAREIGNMVGDVQAVHAEGDQLVASLRFATGTPAADHAWALYGQRLGRQLSIGYRLLLSEEIPPGRSAVINGLRFTAPANSPLRVATRWVLKEVSLVPIGADPAAMMRSFSNFQTERNSAMQSNLLDVLGSNVRSMRFPELLAAGMKRRNHPVPENDLDLVRSALSSVEGVADLVGVVNASILGGFRSAPDSTAGWVRTVELPNFLASQIAAVDVAPRLERVPRGQSAPTVSFAVASEGWRLARFGCDFQIDEQDLLDGQAIGVYATAMEEVGRAARRLVPDLVYSLLLSNAAMADGTPIFDASRGNYATAALANGALGSALAAVGNQVGRDESGDPVHIGYAPGFLVVPPDLAVAARTLARAIQLGDGDLIVRADSRLGTAGIVDPRTDEIVAGTVTNWLLTCPSDQAAGLVIGALNGRVEPTIRQYRLGNGEWGVGFDCKLDLAATAVDAKPLYWSAGTV